MTGGGLVERPRPARDSEAAATRLWAFAAAVVGILLVAETVILVVQVIPANWSLGQDFQYYANVGQTWLDTGQYYLPRQLEGPYVVRLMEDVLYPPSGLFLFVPAAVLGAAFWWAVPVAVTGYVLWHLRPAPWTWVVMLALLCYPRAIGAYLFGNTDMWAVAGVAAGFRWGWPAVLLLLKPTLAPFALLGLLRRTGPDDSLVALDRRNLPEERAAHRTADVRPLEAAMPVVVNLRGLGIRVSHLLSRFTFHDLTLRRSWLAALVLLGLASLPMLPLWFDYLDAARNMRIDPLYSLGSLPLLAVPVVAWLGRSARPDRVFVEIDVRPGVPQERQGRGLVDDGSRSRLDVHA